MPADKSADIVALDEADPIWGSGDTRKPVVHIQPHLGAYVIYTCVHLIAVLRPILRPNYLGTDTEPTGLVPPASQRAWTAAMKTSATPS